MRELTNVDAFRPYWDLISTLYLGKVYLDNVYAWHDKLAEGIRCAKALLLPMFLI